MVDKEMETRNDSSFGTSVVDTRMSNLRSSIELVILQQNVYITHTRIRSRLDAASNLSL